MKRKKTHLWLHKPKISKLRAVRTFLAVKANTDNSDTLSDTNNTKRAGSVQITVSPKRQKMTLDLESASPCQSTSDVPDILSETSTNETPFLAHTVTLESKDRCDEKKSQIEEQELLAIVLHKLAEVGKESDFLNFLGLVKEDKHPLNNIAFLLFLETARFFSTSHSSNMWYWDETKRFWKTGYRMFHAKFLYFMGGPKYLGQGPPGISSESMLPENANINFAVPNLGSLSQFTICEVGVPVSIPPGILLPVIQALGESVENKFMLCADAKKVTAGVDTKGGDVDMFGYEDGFSLRERKEKVDSEVASLTMIDSNIAIYDDHVKICDYDEETKPALKTMFHSAIKTVGSRIKDGREMQFKQKLGLNKFKSMAGERWQDSRYVYVISSLQASLFQLKEFIQSALSAIGMMGMFASQLQESISQYNRDSVADRSYQNNMLCLKETDKNDKDINSNFIKQRSELWHNVRKKARVTGSTLHTAIGLRGLKAQKKHYEVYVEGHTETFSDDVKERMEYGTSNENNAVATLVSRFLPVYFPEDCFVEEGCYLIPGENTPILTEVSPDGSIRRVLFYDDGQIAIGDVKAAVEIKCPFPSERHLPVHYILPEYYVCQCLAEMVALNTNLLVYLSYSTESSTLFKVHFCEELWDMIISEVKYFYDNPNPTKPLKPRVETKIIKEKIKLFVESKVEFIAEIPSVQMINSGLSRMCSNLPFLRSWPRNIPKPYDYTNEEVRNELKKACSTVENGYFLMRRRATEIMVWVLTNKHRNSTLEIPCSLPIAYGLKDYRLTAKSMREATECVLQTCAKAGLHVLSFATDGQWLPVMVRDAKGKPLTLFQLQKDIWAACQKMTKAELSNNIVKLNLKTDDDPLEWVNMSTQDNGSLSVTNKDPDVRQIKTSKDAKLWNTKIHAKENLIPSENEASKPVVSENTDWLPDSILATVESSDDIDVSKIIASVSASTPISDEYQNSNTEEFGNTDVDIGYLFETDIQKSNEAGYQASTDTVMQDKTELPQKNANLYSLYDGDYLNPVQPYLGHNEPKVLVSLTQDNVNDVLVAFRSNTKASKRWTNSDSTSLTSVLSSRQNMTSLTHVELNVMHDTLRKSYPKQFQMFKKSWRKDDKIKLFGNLFGLSELKDDERVTTKKLRIRTPAKLQQLCFRIIKSKQYPKAVLTCAFASYTYPKKLTEWQNSFPVAKSVRIKNVETEIPFWFSYPETSESTGYLLAKSIDCSHNFTHLRVRSCTTGICGISPYAWKACAKANQTPLTVPLVEDLIDKQSVPNARTHFSEEVEKWMFENGYKKAAKLTNLIRSWYEASDKSGMKATERIKHLINMRNFLLDGVSFGTFPPASRFQKGIPVITFEGMLMDIDSKLQMYGMTGSYNIRTVGSLAAETTVGILQSLYPTNQVSIKARDVPSLISTVVEVMTCKINPNR